MAGDGSLSGALTDWVTIRVHKDARKPAQMIQAAHDLERTCPDQALAALLRTGFDDNLAWRVVLQIVLPGVARVIRNLAPGEHRLEDVAATVVTATWG